MRRRIANGLETTSQKGMLCKRGRAISSHPKSSLSATLPPAISSLSTHVPSAHPTGFCLVSFAHFCFNADKLTLSAWAERESTASLSQVGAAKSIEQFRLGSISLIQPALSLCVLPIFCSKSMKLIISPRSTGSCLFQGGYPTAH